MNQDHTETTPDRSPESETPAEAAQPGSDGRTGIQGEAPQADATPGGSATATRTAHAAARDADNDPMPSVDGENATEVGDQLRDMFGMNARGWESYEALDQHIKRNQVNAVIGMIVIPVASLLAVLGLYLVGAERYAMALAIPLLFLAGISMMTANIGRVQLPKLKRIRDNWQGD